MPLLRYYITHTVLLQTSSPSILSLNGAVDRIIHSKCPDYGSIPVCLWDAGIIFIATFLSTLDGLGQTIALK